MQLIEGLFIHLVPFTAHYHYFSVDSLLWEKRKKPFLLRPGFGIQTTWRPPGLAPLTPTLPLIEARGGEFQSWSIMRNSGMGRALLLFYL